MNPFANNFDPLRDVYTNESYPSYWNRLWVPTIIEWVLLYDQEKYNTPDFSEQIIQQLWHFDVAAYTVLKRIYPSKSFATIQLASNGMPNLLSEWKIDMNSIEVSEVVMRWTVIYVLRYWESTISFVELQSIPYQKSTYQWVWESVTQDMLNIFDTLNGVESIKILLEAIEPQDTRKKFSISFKAPWFVWDSLLVEKGAKRWRVSLKNQDDKVIAMLKLW